MNNGLFLEIAELKKTKSVHKSGVISPLASYNIIYREDEYEYTNCIFFSRFHKFAVSVLENIITIQICTPKDLDDLVDKVSIIETILSDLDLFYSDTIHSYAYFYPEKKENILIMHHPKRSLSLFAKIEQGDIYLSFKRRINHLNLNSVMEYAFSQLVSRGI